MSRLVIALFGLLVSMHGFADEFPGPVVGDTAVDASVLQVTVDNIKINKSILLTNQPNQYLLIEFGTTWCPACNSNLPILSKLSSDIANLATTRLVLIDKEMELSLKYIEDNKEVINFDTAIDSERAAWSLYKTGYVPTSYLVSRDGKILWKHVGSYSAEDVATIKGLIHE